MAQAKEEEDEGRGEAAAEEEPGEGSAEVRELQLALARLCEDENKRQPLHHDVPSVVDAISGHTIPRSVIAFFGDLKEKQIRCFDEEDERQSGRGRDRTCALQVISDVCTRAFAPVLSYQLMKEPRYRRSPGPPQATFERRTRPWEEGSS